MENAKTESSPVRPRLTPRRLLGRILILIVLAGVISWAAPFILPIRIVEGPMVQGLPADGAILVWYTSKAGEQQIRSGQAGETGAQVTSHGRRHRAELRFPSTGQPIDYRIYVGDRELARGSIRPPRLPGERFVFIAFGDSGRARREQYELAGQMAVFRDDCDFLIHTGDVVYPGGDRKDYRERFFVPYAPLLAYMPIFPSLGNHDVSKPHFGAPYREIFELPENGPAGQMLEDHYWFDYANARFVVVNSNLDEPVLRDTVAPWMRSALESSTATWKFAVFHHPPYSVGKHGSNAVMQRTLVPVLEAAGADVVFNGHDHIYERTQPIRGGQVDENGIVYIITGAGGASLYEVQPAEQRPAWAGVVNNEVYSFTRVEIEGPRLKLEQIDRNGKRIDAWERVKQP